MDSNFCAVIPLICFPAWTAVILVLVVLAIILCQPFKIVVVFTVFIGCGLRKAIRSSISLLSGSGISFKGIP